MGRVGVRGLFKNQCNIIYYIAYIQHTHTSLNLIEPSGRRKQNNVYYAFIFYIVLLDHQ